MEAVSAMAEIKSVTQYLGSVAAAERLGVSRSTIHKAVTTGALVPDMRTPHGHARFSLETLEAFREDLASEAPREMAREPGPEAVALEARLLAGMVQLLTSKTEVSEVCGAALGIIKQLVPHVHMGHVALHTPTEGDPWGVRVVAHEGYTPDAITTYWELGQASGPFTTDEVVRTGKMVRIETPKHPGGPVRSGTMLFLRQLDVHTFVALPLLAGGRSIGALVLLSHRPHAWGAAEVELLQAVADHLGATVAAAQVLTRRRRMLSGGRDLVALALRLKGRDAVEAFERLAEEYRVASDAVGICVLGLGQDVLVGDERLREHAARARVEGVPRLDFLDGEELIQTVVASALELPGGERAGLAAIWPGRRTDLEAQHKLLTIFGGACVLALASATER